MNDANSILLEPSPPATADASERLLAGLRLGVDGRPFSGPHTGFAMYLRALLPPLLDAGACVTLVSDRPMAGATELLERCEQIVIGEAAGPLRWEQGKLREHLEAANYEFYLASRNAGLPLRYRGATMLLVAILDVIPWKFPRRYFWKKPRFTGVYLTSLAIALWKARAILTISEASRRDIAKLAPGRMIYSNWIRLPDNPDVGKVACPLGEPYFVYVGGRDPRKGNALLLEAYARFRAGGGAAKLVLVGRGYEPLEPLIASLGINGHVIITGYVDDDTRTAWLAGALALIYPSVYEGFGLPIAEALQVGVRAVTGRGGSLPEIGGDAAEYLEPLTVESVAEAMRRLAADPVADAAFRERARAQIARLSSDEIDRGVVATFARLRAGRKAEGVVAA